MNGFGSGFIPIITYGAQSDAGTPTPGSSFMITESGSNRMILENGNPMITE